MRQALVVTGPPAGFITVGGYRFPLQKLLETVARINAGATLTAELDPLIGHRLIGTASDCAAMQIALNAYGLNPLVAAAFTDHGEQQVQKAVAAS